MKHAIVTFALLSSIFAATDAGAQNKDRRCVANFEQACLNQCQSRGGQIRYCTGWCQQRKRELGC